MGPKGNLQYVLGIVKRLFTNCFFVELAVMFTFLLYLADLEDKGAISINLRDKKIISKDADPEKERPVMQDIIPNLKDFVIAYSTVPSRYITIFFRI